MVKCRILVAMRRAHPSRLWIRFRIAYVYLTCMRCSVFMSHHPSTPRYAWVSSNAVYQTRLLSQMRSNAIPVLNRRCQFAPLLRHPHQLLWHLPPIPHLIVDWPDQVNRNITDGLTIADVDP